MRLTRCGSDFGVDRMHTQFVLRVIRFSVAISSRYCRCEETKQYLTSSVRQIDGKSATRFNMKTVQQQPEANLQLLPEWSECHLLSGGSPSRGRSLEN